MLKFYANPISPFAQRVIFFLEETRIPHEFIFLRPEDLSTASFKKISTFQTVPAIELNGFVMSESLAILRFLAQRYEKSDWYPPNLEVRARIDEVMGFVSEHIAHPLMTLGKELTMAPLIGQATNQTKVENARADLLKYMPRFERYITNRTYACSPTPSIADAALAPFMHMYRYAQFSMTDFPQIKAYADRMVDLPSMKKVLAAVEIAYKNRR